MYRFFKAFLALLLVFEIDNPSFAEEPTKEEKAGWFWYRYEPPSVEPEDAVEKEEPASEGIFIPKLSDYSYERLMAMHPKELKPLYEAFHEKMVQSPTVENALEYQIVKEVARRKASAAAAAMVLVAQKYPDLDAQTGYPASNAGRTAFQSMRKGEVESVIRDAQHDFGLVYFFRYDCPYCQAMWNAIELFISKYGWEIKEIDTARNAKAAELFEVDKVPYLMVISRQTGEQMAVTAGVISLDELEERLYRAVRFLKGEGPSSMATYEFQRGSAMDGEVPIVFPDEVDGD